MKNRLKVLRESTGLTQEQLGELIGVFQGKRLMLLKQKKALVPGN